MKRIVIFAVVVLVLLVVFFEFAVPVLIERSMEMVLGRNFGGDYDIDLKAHPTLKMLFGKFDSVIIKVKNINVSGVIIDEVSTKINDVKLNLQKLINERSLEFEGKKEIEGTITISEENIKSALRLKGKGFSDAEVSITPQYTVVKGSAQFTNKPFDFTAYGRFIKLDRTKIGFILDRIFVGSVEIPENLQEMILSGTVFYLDISEAPVPLELNDVVMENSRIVLSVSSKAR